MRLERKRAIACGAGQTPGDTIGNGRAIATLFAREGAHVLCVDRIGARAEETAIDRIFAVNLKGAWLAIKAALPALRESHGAIVNISSLASLGGASMIGYEMSKAALNRLTLSVALSNAKHGVRCNAILPGLMDTPMAIAGISAQRGVDPETLRAERSARVPLLARMGDGWDTAYAALFLASDEAKFITGALLPVDGGMSARIG